MEWLPYCWFGLTILFLAAETSTVSLISLWFAAGSMTAMLAGIFGAALWLQVVLFVAVSCVLLACLRPFVRRFLRPKVTRTNVDALVGTTGYLTEDVDNLKATGRVKLGAMEWSARAENHNTLPAGTLVRVVRIEGAKVFVKEE